jgi:LysM repeat protein
MMTQMRRLTQGLIVSGILNIVLLTLFFYWMVKETPPTPYFQLKPAENLQQIEPLADGRTNSEVLREYKQRSMEHLISVLGNRQQVEDGFTQHDLALGILVADHYFDLTRALTGLPMPSQMRVLAKAQSSNEKDIIAYPEMSDQQTRAIVNFAKMERWPLTSKGLFIATQDPKKRDNPSLQQAFYATPEFIAAASLFTRTEHPVNKKQLLDVLSEGNWETLHQFSEQQRVSQDLSPARRQKMLLDYISGGSKSAAQLLLKSDGSFAAKKLDDLTVLKILSLIPEKTPEAQAFALEITKSLRSDLVKDSAVARLYQYSGGVGPITKAIPKKEDKILPLAYTPVPPAYTPAPSIPKANSVKTPPQKEQLYTVQKGDSLWKIAKKYKITTAKLREYNHLRSDVLKPGTNLKIPN